MSQTTCYKFTVFSVVFFLAFFPWRMQAQTYCTPRNIGNYNTYYISQISFQTIVKNSNGTTGGYSDFSATESTNLNRGETANGTVTVNLNTWNSNSVRNQLRVWVDFNDNGSFEDSGENFVFPFQGNNSGITTVPIRISVPNTAVLASTRMRIGLRDTNDNQTYNSCDMNYKAGEIEDYSVNIVNVTNQNFYDSDGDGVKDNIDIDDDNDGIPDRVEELACNATNSSTTANYKFLNETFGVGPGRGNGISSLYTASTSYCIEDGTSRPNTADCPSLNDRNLNDGEYTINHKITDGIEGENYGAGNYDAIASYAWFAWGNVKDHTPDDADNDNSEFGNMAIFNADVDPGVFYETSITGTLPGVPITYSFWVMNIDNKDSAFPANGLDPETGSRIKPNITVRFLKTDDTLISEYSTGDILRCNSGNDCDVSEWQLFEPEAIVTTESQFIVQFINNAPGGLGNDLAIDDIKIQQTLCDTDGDGVADVFDLDSDNDGIPDIVEAGFGANSNGTAKIDSPLTASNDANNNGMLDSLEGLSIPDTDGDGIPNYLDLDSDNDGIFDVDESGVGNQNSTDLDYVNGDGDISGNGVGNGIDSERFRIKDTNGDGTIEYFGDGILDVFDFFENYNEGADFATAYGNDGQGSEPFYTVDSDNDGKPDYLDVYNNITRTYDIHSTIYANLDTNNDGLIDDTADGDGDGVMGSRDGNDRVFGSPRDLNNSYSLYFDGRNDYVEDENILNSDDATIMAFFKKDVGNNTQNNNQRIAGQNRFHIRINRANRIVAVINGDRLFSDPISENIWTHVAVSTHSNKSVLYVNGVQVDSLDSGGVSNDTSKFRIGNNLSDNQFFKGQIDEVRVFNRALTTLEVKRMVYQELGETNTSSNFNQGQVIPQEISSAISNSLIRYYKMNGYQDDILDDKKTNPSQLDTILGAKIYNVKNIYLQTAPLPYVTKANGDWTDTNTWLHGSVWDITSKGNNPEDASIVHIKHNLNVSKTQGMVGLQVDPSQEFSIKDNSGLYNSWYLQLNGQIDLEGESQLIQTFNSKLYVSPSGKIERDQQGTVNMFTYNYWSSPVHSSATSSIINGTETFKIQEILKDGTQPNTPQPISFVGGYNGATSPMRIAKYWLYKFDNLPSDSYADWQQIRLTDALKVGTGYTMKGTSTGPETDYQNYTFIGKPNNGTIELPIFSGNDYLVGNPYPSAIDSYKFLLDNENVISGTLYFWEHFGGGSHITAEYQGGYGMYNLSGGTPPLAGIMAQPDNDVSPNGMATKTPKRFIPVAQGFFVVANTGGNIVFNNQQRAFVKEGSDNANSWFFRSNSDISEMENNDTRPKLRIGYLSPNNYKRQLLLTVDENATTGVDWGFDGELNEVNPEDMFWKIEGKDYLIQGIDAILDTVVLPLTIKTSQGGIIEITIDSLEHIPDNTEIYLKDGDTYHNLRASNYLTTVESGEINNRFKIVFDVPETLSVNDYTLQNELVVFYNSTNKTIVLVNPENLQLKTLTMYNMLGQQIKLKKMDSNDHRITIPVTLQTGVYLFKIETEFGGFTKKVIIN